MLKPTKNHCIQTLGLTMLKMSNIHECIIFIDSVNEQLNPIFKGHVKITGFYDSGIFYLKFRSGVICDLYTKDYKQKVIERINTYLIFEHNVNGQPKREMTLDNDNLKVLSC